MSLLYSVSTVAEIGTNTLTVDYSFIIVAGTIIVVILLAVLSVIVAVVLLMRSCRRSSSEKNRHVFITKAMLSHLLIVHTRSKAADLRGSTNAAVNQSNPSEAA